MREWRAPYFWVCRATELDRLVVFGTNTSPGPEPPPQTDRKGAAILLDHVLAMFFRSRIRITGIEHVADGGHHIEAPSDRCHDRDIGDRRRIDCVARKRNATAEILVFNGNRGSRALVRVC